MRREGNHGANKVRRGEERAQTQYLRTEPSDRSRFDFEGGNRFPIARGWSYNGSDARSHHAAPPGKLLPACRQPRGPPFPLSMDQRTYTQPPRTRRSSATPLFSALGR